MMNENINISQIVAFPDFNDPSKILHAQPKPTDGFLNARRGLRTIKKIGADGRTEQILAFDKLKAKPGEDDVLGSVLDAPGAWGKSVEVNSLIIHDVVHFGRKQLATVPDGTIAKGFTRQKEFFSQIIEVEGVVYELDFEKGSHNFCTLKESVHGDSTRITGVLKFLLTSAEDLAKEVGGYGDKLPEDEFLSDGIVVSARPVLITGVVAICCHASLRGALEFMEKSPFDEIAAFMTPEVAKDWVLIPDAEKRDWVKRLAMKNLSLRIDEGHHSDGIYSDDDDLTAGQKAFYEQEGTMLGQISRIVYKEPSARLHLSTGTFMRGDLREIVHAIAMKKLNIFQADRLKHFQSLGIGSVQIGFQEYEHDGDPFDLIYNAIEMEPKQYHFVVMPSKSRFFRRDKDNFLVFVNRLSDKFGGRLVLDFVDATKSKSDANKKIMAVQREKFEDDEPEGGDVRVVIVCMVGREGFDWPPCSRIHHTSPESSARLAIQTFWRMMRSFRPKDAATILAGLGKTDVRMISYIQKQSKLNPNRIRDILADRTNAYVYMMVVQESINPILMPTVPVPDGVPDKIERLSLHDVFGTKYQDVVEGMIKEIAAAQAKGMSEIEARAKAIDSIIKKFPTDIPSSTLMPMLGAMADKLLGLRLVSATISSIIDVSFMRKKYSFDKLDRTTFLDRLLADFVGVDLIEARVIIKEHFLKYSWEQWKKVVDEARIQSVPGYNTWIETSGDSLLPLDPSARYDEFKSLGHDNDERWARLRGRPLTRSRSSRRPSAKKALELAYGSHVRTLEKQGRTPLSMTEWLAKKG